MQYHLEWVVFEAVWYLVHRRSYMQASLWHIHGHVSIALKIWAGLSVSHYQKEWTQVGHSTVRVFKIDAAIWKPFRRWSGILRQTKMGRPKRKCRSPKRERGRYVSEAAPRFGNLCVYEPSALRKKPSASLEKTSDSQKKLSDSWKKPSDLRKKPSSLQRRRATNAFQKGVPNRAILKTCTVIVDDVWVTCHCPSMIDRCYST